MTRKFLGSSAAAFALLAALGTAAQAQDKAPAAAPSPVEFQLPQLLGDLGLTDLETKQSPRGTKVEGELPGGGEIEAYLNPEGKPVMIEVDDADMPQSIREAMLPQSVRDNAILSQFASIEKIGTRGGFVMIDGEDADGEDLRAGFDAEGRLMRFGRDDDDHRRGPRDMRHGEGEHRHMDKGEHGDRGAWGGPHHDDDRRSHGRGDGPRGSIDSAAVTKTLEGAGYSKIETPRPAGPRLVLDAVNPAGETVTVEVDSAGEVVRELAR